MLNLKVWATNDVTDLDYCKRRIEKLGFYVTRFGNELYVRQGPHQFLEHGFRLAQFLNNNCPALIEYDVSDEHAKEWRAEDESVLHTDTMKRMEAEEAIRQQDPT